MIILPAFLKFKNEAALIGRMLAGYADLEVDFMNCVQVVRDDLDTVLKAMFRARGESQRIDIGDALGRQHYHRIGLGTNFEMAVGAVRYCLRLRNQYAHCLWYDDNSGRLAFVNLEDIAREHVNVTDLKKLSRRYVALQLLQSQLEYFEYAQEWLLWVNFEGQFLAKTIRTRVYERSPAPLKPPAFYNP